MRIKNQRINKQKQKTMASNSSNSHSLSHVVLFPFMSKGHTIPLLKLAHLLLHRFQNLSITIFTTKSNHPFISQFLNSNSNSISIIDLPFPQEIPGIPIGIENTENLPSNSLLPDFVMSTKFMQQDFERELQRLLPRIAFLISDYFLWWTSESASKFGIPRFSFSGMSNYTGAITGSVLKNRLLSGPELENELITVPDFPWIKVTKNDWDPVFKNLETLNSSLHSEFIFLCRQSTTNSYGIIVNSFYELESVFCDYVNNDELKRPKAWCIGPVCLAEKPKPEAVRILKPKWLEWLDQMKRQGKSVLYIAFGSQANISQKQMKEIAIGLEKSEVNFLWVLKNKIEEDEDEDGFEERVRGRGMVQRGWVEQWEVLKHESVKGFLSHCGWNSVIESICCGVPILAWPLVADQALNARMVVEEIKVGLRGVEDENCGGSLKGFLERNELEKKVRGLMDGVEGERVREKVMEFSEMAKKAMENNGSSWKTLECLVEEMCSNDEGKRVF